MRKRGVEIETRSIGNQGRHRKAKKKKEETCLTAEARVMVDNESYKN